MNKDAKVFLFIKKEEWNLENENLLKKIMSAVKINLETDTNLLLLEAHQDAYVSDELNPQSNQYFFAFGLNAKRLGIQTRTLPYKWMQIDHLHILFSHTLTDLQKNVNYKKQLWAVLKEMNINE